MQSQQEDPGFDTAIPLENHPAAADDPTICHNCRIMLAEEGRFLVNGRVTCDYCAAKLQPVKTAQEQKKEPAPGASAAALVFGAAAAFFGAVIYASLMIVTGYEMGFMALALGWVVGYAVKRGADGKATPGLRVAGMLFVYLAMVASQMGAGLYQIYTESGATQKQALLDATGQLQKAGNGAVAGTVGIAFFISALTYPFVGGFMGIVFIAVGLFEAWRISAPAVDEDTGPVRVRPGAA